MSSLHKTLKKKKYIKIPFATTATNHIEIKAKINGVKGHFILDTGASNTCISIDKIDLFKLTSKESDIKAAGAGATNMETLTSNKNKIKIGEWRYKKLNIVLFDLSHVNEALTTHNARCVDGIIGADILIKGKAIIDYDQKHLYLKTK